MMTIPIWIVQNCLKFWDSVCSVYDEQKQQQQQQVESYAYVYYLTAYFLLFISFSDLFRFLPLLISSLVVHIRAHTHMNTVFFKIDYHIGLGFSFINIPSFFPYTIWNIGYIWFLFLHSIFRHWLIHHIMILFSLCLLYSKNE